MVLLRHPASWAEQLLDSLSLWWETVIVGLPRPHCISQSNKSSFHIYSDQAYSFEKAVWYRDLGSSCPLNKMLTAGCGFTLNGCECEFTWWKSTVPTWLISWKLAETRKQTLGLHYVLIKVSFTENIPCTIPWLHVILLQKEHPPKFPWWF